jgi:hypothetical protein
MLELRRLGDPPSGSLPSAGEELDSSREPEGEDVGQARARGRPLARTRMRCARDGRRTNRRPFESVVGSSAYRPRWSRCSPARGREVKAAFRTRDHTLDPEAPDCSGDCACRDAQLGVDLAWGGAPSPAGEQAEDSAALLLHEGDDTGAPGRESSSRPRPARAGLLLPLAGQFVADSSSESALTSARPELLPARPVRCAAKRMGPAAVTASALLKCYLLSRRAASG